MKTTMWALRAASLLTAAMTLGGCALPDKPVQPSVYDFGPGPTPTVATQPSVKPATAALVLADISTTAALDSTAMLYRLAYADAQQLRPYANSRWSTPPAQLLQQRIRAQIGEHRPILSSAQGLSVNTTEAGPVLVLQLELEEFSQVFSSPSQSVGTLRLRATLTRGGKLVGQQVFAVQRPAQQADAQGGVQALGSAADAVTQELLSWIGTLASR